MNFNKQNTPLFLLVIITVFTISNCSKDHSTGLSLGILPTPFDTSSFSGYYTSSYLSTSSEFSGKIGKNGVISVFVMNGLDTISYSGETTPDGKIQIVAILTNSGKTMTLNFYGQLDSTSTDYSGSGTWTSSTATTLGTQVVAGTWNITGGKQYVDQTNTPDFLCWTGSDDTTMEFKLVRMNGSTGNVSAIGGQDYMCQLVYGPDGTLYGIAADLNIVDPTTGTTSSLGYFSYEATNEVYILMSGAEFSPEGTLYVVENGGNARIFTVDMNTRALTLVGICTSMTRDIAFSPNGIMYAGSSSIVILDPSTVAVKSTLCSFTYLGGSMFFDSHKNLLKNDIFPAKNLYTINTVLGISGHKLPIGCSGIGAVAEERKPLQKTGAGLAKGTMGKHSKNYCMKLEQAYKAGTPFRQ